MFGVVDIMNVPPTRVYVFDRSFKGNWTPKKIVIFQPNFLRVLSFVCCMLMMLDVVFLEYKCDVYGVY